MDLFEIFLNIYSLLGPLAKNGPTPPTTSQKAVTIINGIQIGCIFCITKSNLKSIE